MRLLFCLLLSLAAFAQSDIVFIRRTPATGGTPPSQVTGQECHAYSTGSTPNTFSCNLPSAVTANNLIAVGVWVSYTGASMSCSDATNGAYTAVTSQRNDSSAGRAYQFFYFKNAAAVTTISCTLSQNDVSGQMVAIEIEGASTTDPVDSYGSGTGSAGFTTVAANTFALGLVVHDSAVSDPAWSQIDSYGWYQKTILDGEPFPTAGVKTYDPTTSYDCIAAAFKP